MTTFDIICIWCAEVVPLIFSGITFAYGVKRFFKKGKALYLQIVTTAIGCFSLGYVYHVCQHLVLNKVTEGFTASYLGLMGFFLFLFTANFGQMNGILDDGTPRMLPSRYIALLGPLLAIILYIPCALVEMQLSTKLANLVVWITASLSMYYNLKHAIIPDLGSGFAKAVRPYNICAFIVSVLVLLMLAAWCYYDTEHMYFFIVLLSFATGIMMVVTLRNLEKGVAKWTI